MLAFRKTLDSLTVFIIYALAFLLPLILTNLTTEYFETAKLVLLGSASLLLLLLWVGRVYTDGKLTIVKTPLDLLFLLFLVVAFLSTVLSQTPYPALFGLLPKVHGSLIFITALVLLYFMVVSNIKNQNQTQTIVFLMITSGLILSLVSLLSFFNIYLPFKVAESQTFSLAGSPLQAAVYLTLLLPVILNLCLSGKNLRYLSLLGFIATTLFAITIILIGNSSVWIGAALAVAATLYFHQPTREQVGVVGTVGVIVALVAILAYTPTLKDKTELGRLTSGLEREAQLPLGASWKISAGAFRDSPILGTGPGTYPYNFTQYKPLEINRSDFWDKRINSAHNQYLQTLSEMGGAGLIILLLIAVSFTSLALKNLRSGSLGDSGSPRGEATGLALSGITFMVLLALSPMGVLTQGSGVLLLALFMNFLRGKHHQVRLMEVNLTPGYGNVHPLIPSILFVPVLGMVMVGFYFLGKLSLGEYYHRQSLNAAVLNKPQEAYNRLIDAERVNPEADLYRVNLANTNFALANGLAASKGPTEASPGGSLTEDDKRTIQTLLQQAITEGRVATNLSPRSAFNWEALAKIYQQLSGVAQNATAFTLDSYGKAIQRDPLNPALRVAVGQVYYQAKNYDLAVRFFDDAVSLKSDYSSGLYNLTLALRDKGKTEDAVNVAERLTSLLQDKPDSEDYKQAAELLTELKEKQASLTPPTSPTSPLEQTDLPKVDIGQPEKVATPPAVQP